MLLSSSQNEVVTSIQTFMTSSEYTNQARMARFKKSKEGLFAFGKRMFEVQKPSKKDIVNDYFNSATVHGLAKIHGTKGLVFKLFWIVIFLVVLGFLIRAVVGLFVKVLADELTVSIQTKTMRKGMPFPTITICNSNPFSANKTKTIKGKPFIDNRDKLIRYTEFYADLLNSTGAVDPIPPYLDYNIIESYFNGEKIDEATQFTINTTWGLGKCFTFNTEGKLKQVRPGNIYGLLLTVFINQVDYDLDVPSLPDSAGLEIYIYSGHGLFPSLGSILVAPGEYTSISMKRSTFKRAKYPLADNCTDRIASRKLFTGRYTTQSCLETCFLLQLQKACGAVSPFSYSNVNFKEHLKPATTSNDIDCILGFVEKYDDTSEECVCPLACEEDVFDARSSHSAWPTRKATARYETLIKNSIFSSQNLTAFDYVASNYLVAEIYFNDFTVTTTTSKEAYGWDNLASDLGGQLGLWIGASVFSVFELGSFLLALLLGYIDKKRRKTHTPEGKDSILNDKPTDAAQPELGYQSNVLPRQEGPAENQNHMALESVKL